MFSHSKTVLSVYGAVEENMSKDLPKYLIFDGLSEKEASAFADANISKVYQANIAYCDGVALSGSRLTDEMKDFIKANVSNVVDVTESKEPHVEIKKLYEDLSEEESIA